MPEFYPAKGTPAPVGAQFVTLATDATLTDERVLTAGAGITLTDGGAGSTVTVAAPYALNTNRSGVWYRAISPVSGAPNATQTLNRLWAVPVWLSAGTLDRIAAQHWAFATSGETLRLGIYKDSDGVPNTLVLDAGTIDLSTATAYKTITISQAILTGFYWLCAVRQGSTSTATLIVYGGSDFAAGQHGIPLVGSSNVYDVRNCCYVDSVTGALPSSFGTPVSAKFSGNNVPMVSVRYA